MVTWQDRDWALRVSGPYTLPELWGGAGGWRWPAKLKGDATSHGAEQGEREGMQLPWKAQWVSLGPTWQDRGGSECLAG